MNEAERFPPPSVVLPSGVGRPLEDIWRAVAHLVATCLRWYGAPADLWRESAGGSRGMARGLFLLRRAQTVLRYVMLIYARHFLRDAVFPPPRARRCAAHAPRRTPKADNVFSGCVSFLMPRRYRAFVRASNALQPAHLKPEARNPLRVVARRMEGLRRVLEAPMPHVKRLARMLSREMLHAPHVERRRRPPAWRRDLWEELEDVRRMAWWAFTKENHYFNSS